MRIAVMLRQRVELELVHLLAVEFYLFRLRPPRILAAFLHKSLAFGVVGPAESSPPLLDESRLGVAFLQLDFPSGCLEDVAFGFAGADGVLLHEFAGGGVGAGLPEGQQQSLRGEALLDQVELLPQEEVLLRAALLGLAQGFGVGEGAFQGEGRHPFAGVVFTQGTRGIPLEFRLLVIGCLFSFGFICLRCGFGGAILLLDGGVGARETAAFGFGLPGGGVFGFHGLNILSKQIEFSINRTLPAVGKSAGKYQRIQGVWGEMGCEVGGRELEKVEDFKLEGHGNSRQTDLIPLSVPLPPSAPSFPSLSLTVKAQQNPSDLLHPPLDCPLQPRIGCRSLSGDTISIQMFLGLGLGNRNSDQTIQTCWPLLQLGFKFFFVVSLCTSLLSFLFPALILYLPNNIPRTIEELQLWRLLSSFLVNGSGLSAVLRILFVYYLMYITLPDLERKYSTAWAFLEVVLQILLSNLVLVAVGYPLLVFDLVGLEHVLGYGAFPLVINFLWQVAAADPEKPTRFCCFPCLIALKWVPWCFTGLTCLLGDTLISNVVYCLLGFYQHSIRKKSLVSTSLAVYRRFDSLMPKFIIESLGYVKVSAVEDALKTVCSKGCCEGETIDFATNEQVVNERVEVIGRGTVIGGANIKPVKQEDFKAYWEKKGVKEGEGDEVPQLETPNIEQEVKPQMEQSHDEESFDFGQTNVVEQGQQSQGTFTLGYELNPPKVCPPAQPSSSSSKLKHQVLVEEYPDSAFS